jgi:hypothetical protein
MMMMNLETLNNLIIIIRNIKQMMMDLEILMIFKIQMYWHLEISTIV